MSRLTPSDLAALRAKYPVSEAVAQRSLCTNKPEPGCQVGDKTGKTLPPAASRDDLPLRSNPRGGCASSPNTQAKRKPLMNKTELRYKAILEARGVVGIMDQSITLRLEPPFKSYRPDMAYLTANGLCFVEVKGPHRFRRAGIAKAALAAKTYPQFSFLLAEWTGKEWKEQRL